MNRITDRLSRLREAMKSNNIDMYYIPTEDHHLSEYIGDYFKCREYITGFTGSAGSALVTPDAAFLWVDGRYFIQGEEQTRDSGIILMKMGEPGVPEIHEYIRGNIKAGERFGFDGRCVSFEEAERFEAELKEHHAAIVTDLDLVGMIWGDRPSPYFGPVTELSVKWCGEERSKKLRRLRKQMAVSGAESIFFGALDDIAWLLNLRGCDVPMNPVFLSFLYVGMDNAVLFANRASFDASVLNALGKDGIKVQPFREVCRFLKNLSAESIWLTKSQVSYLCGSCVPKKTKKVYKEDPISLMKAVKNPVEVRNMRMAHNRDGAAVIRFIIWLKENVGKTRITEMSAAKKLLSFIRQELLRITACWWPMWSHMTIFLRKSWIGEKIWRLPISIRYRITISPCRP